MKKYTHYILSLIFMSSIAFTLTAQPSCDSIKPDYSGQCIEKSYEKKILLYENGQKLGILETYYNNGQLKMRRSKEILTSRNLNAEFQGEGYYKDGEIKEKIDIVNGTGTIELFREDTIELRAKFYKGRPTGTWKYFSPFVSEEKHIYFDSSKMNTYQNFEALYNAFKEYEDLFRGITRDVSTYNGLFREYHSKGNLLRETNYVDGKMVDTIKTYSIQGHLSEEASVSAKIDNEVSGFAKWYESNGNIDSYFEFENCTGTFYEYSSEEQVSYTGFYKNGTAHGIWLVKDSSDQILYEVNYDKLSPKLCKTMSCIMEDFANKRMKMRKLYDPDYVNPWDLPPPRRK